LQNNKEILCCAEQFGVVGDATRLKICYLLCRHSELNVSDMAEILDTSVSVVSHSVKKLLELDLVTRRKEAQTVYYALADTDFIKNLKGLIT
jgi:DNA-binding transcriptional ArsR family regulator